MSQKANPTLIGLFVIIAGALTFGALMILGSGRFFKETETFVMYFDSDVAGLNVGAPVQFRGVQIGEVADIRLEYHTDTGEALVPVYVKFYPSTIHYVGDRNVAEEEVRAERFSRLRAQLQTQSFVTGLLKIMLIDDPKSPARLVGGDPLVPEIPTVRGFTEDLMDRLEDLPLGDIVENLNASVEQISQLLQSDGIRGTAKTLNVLLENLDRVVAKMDQAIPNASSELTLTATSFRKTLDATSALVAGLNPLADKLDASYPALMDSFTSNADAFLETQQQLTDTMAEIQGMMGDRSSTRYQFASAMDTVNAAARALQEFLDYLERHPEAFLTGKSQSE